MRACDNGSYARKIYALVIMICTKAIYKNCKVLRGVVTVKKIISIMVGILVLSIASIASAEYPTYLNGDRNLIICHGHMGTAWYVDRSSLVVQKYAPPQYIIAVNIVEAVGVGGNVIDFYDGGPGKIVKVKTMRFFYNWDLREMYYDTTGSDGWKYLNPHGYGIRQPAGEIAFYLAYKMRFYGSKPFYDIYQKRTYPVYSDDFYAHI